MPAPDDPRALLESVNAADRDLLVATVRSVMADRAALRACVRFSSAVVKELAGTEFDRLPNDPRGATAVVSILTTHPAFGKGRDLVAASPVLGPGGDDPSEFDARREAAEVLAVGVCALIAENLLDERHAAALTQVAIGADAASRLVRDMLFGGRTRDIDLDLESLIPSRLIDLETLERMGCGHEIAGAAAKLGLGFQPARAWATGITALAPSGACAGATITIQGSGFGAAQPSDVVVMFPTRDGGCTVAQVTAWSDTAVSVVVPASAGPGCVGFASKGTPADFAAATHFADVLDHCIGPAALRVSTKIRRFAGLSALPCAPCLAGGANRYAGAGPIIDGFTANGCIEAVVQPGQNVVLAWSVRNAKSLTLSRAGMQGPFAVPPTPLPATGILDLGPFNGTQPASASYVLRAANACSTETRTVIAKLVREPTLKISSIEVVQAIQRADNSVRLAARKRTVARVFVESGITDGFDYGSGPGVVPGISGRVLVFAAGQGFGTSGAPLPIAALALPAGTHDRNLGTHSFNVELLPTSDLAGPVRIDALVWVDGHETDVGGPWKAFASTSVTFQPRARQEVLPFLISDFGNLLAAPSLAAFNASLQEARKRYPLAEDAYVVHPPITIAASDAFGNPYNLAGAFDWGRLLFDIATMVFLFPSTPTGGVRAGLVPRNGGGLTDVDGNAIPPYAVNGMGSPRVGGVAPAFVCQALLPGTFAHELGHSCGLNHAPCPALPGTPGSGDCSDPPSDIDSRLPGGTEDVGMDVPAGAVIPTGRGELMSYCGDLSRCPGPTRWPSITTWDLLFDTLPI